MIQILGLRSFVNAKGESHNAHRFYEKKWRAPSLLELFRNIEKYVADIPESERWNMFYTVANCKEDDSEKGTKARIFNSLGAIAFDIDKIDVDKIDEYRLVILSTLGLSPKESSVIFSGNGLHFIIHLIARPQTEKFFAENKLHYKAVCEKINKALAEKNLPGLADPAIFDGARILRLPLTINRKPNKPERVCKIISIATNAIDFSLKSLSGLPDLKVGDALPEKILKKYPKTDSKAIFEGCKFLAFAKENPGKINEPQWYAALSITSRMKDGRNLSHDLSKGHTGYTSGDTDQKIEQALAASGPRTCSSISNVWTGCSECPNFGKVKSPILLKSADAILTEDTGFHQIIYSKNGGEVRFKPCPKDLARFFEREKKCVSYGSSLTILVWNGSYYAEMEKNFILEYAELRFDPPTETKFVEEFYRVLLRTNVQELSWFTETTKQKVNFQNGVLDLATMEFFNPSPDYGFRYALPYDYDPEARAPVFKKMMNKITCGDTALENLLLEYAGYAISGDDYWLHKALVCVGEGSNGKSTFLKILKYLVGGNNYSTVTIKELGQEYTRQMLDGKFFNLAEEMPSDALMHNQYFKLAVGGGEMQARSIFKAPYSFANRAKFIFTCNDLPPHKDSSYGFERRLIIAPFNYKFTHDDPDFDPFIDHKLLSELPGIFNLATAAYQRVVAAKQFTKVESVENEIKRYVDTGDSIKMWVDDCVELDPSLELSCMVQDKNEGNDKKIDSQKVHSPIELYEHYKTYTLNLGNKPENYTTFSRRLRKYLPKYDTVKTRTNSKGTCFMGLILKNGTGYEH